MYGLVKAFARCLADKRCTGEDSAHARGPDRPAGLRHRVRSSRWQRMPTTWPTTPSTSCCSGGTRCPARPWRRNPRSRDSRTARAAPCSTGWGASWQRASFERHRRRLNGRARRITIDLDPTDDLTHRGPAAHVLQRALWRLVLSADAGVSELRPRGFEQYLCAAVLRPGKAVAADGTLGLLSRLLPLYAGRVSAGAVSRPARRGLCDPGDLRFPGCGCPGSTTSWRWRRTRCCSGMRSPPCRWPARRARSVARPRTSIPTPATAAGTWDHERRVVIKAEVVRLGDREPRDNPRFVVTNLRQTPRFIYEKVYCARGDIENRIKELLDGLQIDRTSCCLFSANQLRVFLTAAAYVLMQELRLRAARTACARSQVTWLRDRLLKLGVHVVRSVRRVVLHLPRSTPHHSRRGGTSHSRWARAPDSPPVAPRPPASWAAWAAPPAGLSLPNPRVRHAPRVGCSNPGSACRRRCPRPIPAPITPFGVSNLDLRRIMQEPLAKSVFGRVFA